MENKNVECRICKRECKLSGLSSHVRGHKLSYKDYYDKYLKKENEGLCLTCGKETKFIGLLKGYCRFCSSKCSFSNKETKKKIKQTNLERHGVENVSQNKEVQEKIKQTNLEKYGGTGFQAKDLADKTKQTMLEKYGVEYAIQNKDLEKKIKETNLEKYGVDNIFKSKEFQEDLKTKNLEKYGVENISQVQEIQEKISNTKLNKFLPRLSFFLDNLNIDSDLSTYKNDRTEFNAKCKKCGTEFQTKYTNLCQGCNKCPSCFPVTSGKSNEEKEVLEFIKTLDLDSEILENTREIINPKELDIYIPKLSLAIEYDGLYWHSEEMILDPKSHLNKTLDCEKQNIKLIHIFSDEWNLKQDIVKSKLKQILHRSNATKIHARECVIREIKPSIKDEFLEKYHLQGKDLSKIKLGAFYNDELVSVMTFGHGSISRGTKKQNSLIWELSRFCTNYNYHIPGIAGKLLSYFKKNYEWKEIYSYADRRWSNGDLYYKLGFTLDRVTRPNYWYTKDFITRIYRFNLRKTKNDPKDIPERILRIQEGYSRVWDCGLLKFVMRNV